VLTPDEACVVTYQISRALRALHRYGVVHRDVKPANVLMAPDGIVKLFDFGLVLDSEGMLRLFEEEDILAGADFAEDIEKGAVAGTPEYMAPEQFQDALSAHAGSRMTSTTADVFSIGVILYRLLVGSLPHPAPPRSARPRSTGQLLAYLRARASIIGALRRPPRVEPSLWTIITRALATTPERRQPDAKALGGELYGYLTEGTGTQTHGLEAPATEVMRIDPSIVNQQLTVEALFGDLDLDEPYWDDHQNEREE
jgi:serine/threonine-protein kinase